MTTILKYSALASTAFLLCLVTLLGITTKEVSAATKTWTGAVDTDWSTAGNWSPSGAPTNGDDLVFNTTSTPVGGGVNNISGLSVNTISIDNSAETSWGISTSVPMTVTTSVVSTGATANFNGGFILGGNVELRDINVNDYGLGSPSNAIALNGNTLNYNSVTNFILVFDLPITGAGAVEIDISNKPLTFTEVNTYSGTTTINDVQYITHATSLDMDEMFGSSTVGVSGDGALLLKPSASDTTFSTPVTFAGLESFDSLFSSQLIVSDSDHNGSMSMPNITLQGNIRAEAYTGISSVNLAGITANGYCMQYGGATNLQADKFQNGPPACIVNSAEAASAPGVPDTGYELLKNNPLTLLVITLITTGSIVFAAFKLRNNTSNI